MKGLSERDYASRAGLSRGAIQKAKLAGRLVLYADGSIDAEASDARRKVATDPSKQRVVPADGSPAAPKLKPVPTAAVAAVGDTLLQPVDMRRAQFVDLGDVHLVGQQHEDHHSTPLVDGMASALRGSISTASRNARARPLNAASAIWWLLVP